MPDAPVHIVREEILSDFYYPLKNITFEQHGADGDPQIRSHEVYDNASGAAVLLYNRARRSVVLTRQLRIGARLNGHHGVLLEASAGVLDGADPAVCASATVRAQTGYAIELVQPVLTLFMSPGTTTERLHLFVAEYAPGQRQVGADDASGNDADSEVVELDFDDALAMVERGEIVDAKTVLLLLHLERKILGRHGEAS